MKTNRFAHFDELTYLSINHVAKGVAPKINFGQFEQLMLAKYSETPERYLYYYLLNIDEHPDILPTAFKVIEKYLDNADNASLPAELGFFEYHRDEFEECLKKIRSWRLGFKDFLPPEMGELNKERCVYLFKQYAPTAIIDGCWLQNASSAVTSHTEVYTRMLKMYSYEIGDGYPSLNHGNCYLDLMRSLGIYVPDVASWPFAAQDEVLDSSFSLPVFQLCLSQFPRVFSPELLGLNLFYYIYGIPPIYTGMSKQLQEHGASIKFLNFHLLSNDIRGPAQTAIEAVSIYLESARAKDHKLVQDCWRRVWSGFVAAYTTQEPWVNALLDFIASPDINPRAKMVELIRRKAPHAYGYHKGGMVGEWTIDEWFNPETLEPERFVDALAASVYIRHGDSARSPFLKLVSFRGPMFRIFSPEELETITEWIDSLSEDMDTSEGLKGPKAQPTVKPTHSNGTKNGFVPEEVEKKSIRKYSKMPLGDLYYHLLHIETVPDIRPFAKEFAIRWLTRASVGLTKGDKAIPFITYSHEALGEWLEKQHRRQVESYKGLEGEPPQTKEEVIDSSVQLCPMTFIDGTWIQKMGNAAFCRTTIGCQLFRTHADEVGNGDTELNHPNVYRELMDEMEIDLPRFDSLEFGRWEGFSDSAFLVPVFWLCVSQFPKRFLSELIGLNLAMELSGVGGTYRRAIDVLRYYGFDPYFVELHNTIDNISTGHTAWALDAIKIHMDEVFARGGKEQVQEHWERVWSGYRALVPPTGLMNSFIAKIKLMFG